MLYKVHKSVISTSKKAKYSKHEVEKQGSKYIINGYSFDKDWFTFLLPELEEAFRTGLSRFLIEYIDEFVKYKSTDDEGSYYNTYNKEGQDMEDDLSFLDDLLEDINKSKRKYI